MTSVRLMLLGSVALGISAAAAQADDLAILKAELEALNARVAQLEVAPVVPSGYQLLSISEVEALPLTGEKASDYVGGLGTTTSIGILPTADAPAMASVVWSGEVRTALTYRDLSFDRFHDLDDSRYNVNTRARLRVRARSETAVGEVGADFRLQAESEFGSGAATTMEIAWGWWQVTPEWQVGGGYTGSLGNVPFGQDEYVAIGATVEFSPPCNAETTIAEQNNGEDDCGSEQLRLTYSSGPLMWGVAVEQSALTTKVYRGVITGFPASFIAANGDDLPAISSRLSYTTDGFSAALSGIYDGNDSGVISDGRNNSANFDIQDAWQIGVGGSLDIGQSAFISIAAAVGEGTLQSAGVRLEGTSIPFSRFPEFFSGDYWGASVYGRVDPSDTIFIEASLGYTALEARGPESTSALVLVPSYDLGILVANAGIYYAPVDQLTIGLQADYTNFDISNTDVFYAYSDIDIITASLATWFRF